MATVTTFFGLPLAAGAAISGTQAQLRVPSDAADRFGQGAHGKVAQRHQRKAAYLSADR